MARMLGGPLVLAVVVAAAVVGLPFSSIQLCMSAIPEPATSTLLPHTNTLADRNEAKVL